MNTQTTITTDEHEDKPLPNSWRARIRKNKGFVMMVDDFLLLFPEAATNPILKKRIEDNCETLWKLGAAEHCGHNNVKHSMEVATKGEEEIKKKIENIPVLTVKPEDVKLISGPVRTAEKNKRKKKTEKGCDC